MEMLRVTVDLYRGEGNECKRDHSVELEAKGLADLRQEVRYYLFNNRPEWLRDNVKTEWFVKDIREVAV